MSDEFIRIAGARQNNLKGLDLDIPLHSWITVTGVSGSGKSSLAFDTIYAEGQRRYVETFSPYARQFLDRMDKPQADKIEGIPPAIAIDQTNPVRSSRSTVGTMTELNDHLKLLFARAARLHCRQCGKPVQRDTVDHMYARILEAAPVGAPPPVAVITFSLELPQNFTAEEVTGFLRKQGYTRTRRREGRILEVIQDRAPMGPGRRGRIVESLEAALVRGNGKLAVYLENAAGESGEPLRFSAGLHCADCDLAYRDPTPAVFSFNSPLGACETCRGFGRVIGIDYGLVIPDDRLTLAGGAIKPFQTPSYSECQTELVKFAKRRGVPLTTPWRELGETHRRWVIDGEGAWDQGVWYGVKSFFEWLEGRSYKMHIRVLLSKYRTYGPCPVCEGARLKPEALWWRLGSQKRTIRELMLLPIDEALAFFQKLELPKPFDEASQQLLGEIRTRLGYLVEVGLGYLTLDRQSRTLSGGEVQRINLTTALGASLVNTLFVLDEPSIGLHPRDIRRLIAILQRLRDAGNSLIVVEHDPDLIRASDRIVDMGPGPGERGGQIVYAGPLAGLEACKESRTGDYLAGRRRVEPDASAFRAVPARHPSITIEGATAHNLKGVDVSLPLNRLVCVTGVSGSGKSTLIQDILYPALRKRLHKPSETPGPHAGLKGWEVFGDVVLADQSPIGKTARSNPASYVGAWDAIRAIFARAPLSRERGYTASTFSFNSGAGRCAACGGKGFEHIEMQFLSDVFLRCTVCDGQRFRTEVLDVRVPGKGSDRKDASIADVLELTVEEAERFFADSPEVSRVLAPLREVGLGYLRLGQPVPTLSGGEAQRLKLAGYLADAGGGKPILFLFDEPTTGLHFDDIAVLLKAFRRLLAEGHSLVVIEHNLDLIRAADWIVDLGPEGGDAGGELVCAGPPADVAACPASHTGRELRRIESGSTAASAPALLAAEPRAAYAALSPFVRIRGAREHNLQNIDVDIPRDAFSVITGISGSGKSTLAFDILFAEGQRRYLESLNAYARQFVQPASRPEVDAILGIPPTVAIEQRTSRGGRKSTVATVTELYHFMRLLYVKLGVQHCPDCGDAIIPQTADVIAGSLMTAFRGRTLSLMAPLVVARKGYYTDLAEWAAGHGFKELRVDGKLTPVTPWPRLDRFKEHRIDLPVGALKVEPRREKELRALLELALEHGKGSVLAVPLDRKGAGEALYSSRRACPSCNRSFGELDPRLFSYNSKHGWCPHCYGTGLELEGFDEEQTGEEIWWNAWYEGAERDCPDCAGKRLRPEALAVKFREQSIAELAGHTVQESEAWFKGLSLAKREKGIARDIVAEILVRLRFLREVGLPYLTLDRAAPTLSGGEAQRIRLAAQLGSNLRGVCYILDEPTIGLHARDNRMLIDTLRSLERKGNTIVVVEHDEETIRQADHVIDLGPGAGREGGRVVAAGRVKDLMKHADSITGRCLRKPMKHPLAGMRRNLKTGDSLLVKKAALHNLRNLDVRFPLGRLVAVTGVSGSGKSTLVRHVLHDNLKRLLAREKSEKIPLRGCEAIEGLENVRRVLEVDQTPIGKTPRSCPATYVGFWNEIRRLFAALPEARIRGYMPGRFSFNVSGGRCEACEGQGVKKIEMSFLPDVTVPCEVCNGARFAAETLVAKLKGKTVAEVLAMSVDEAVTFFEVHPAIHRPLRLMQDVGLGYLTLGQQSPTLSGGEAQRIKLVTELSGGTAENLRRKPGGTLYVLDEPTVGLHLADIKMLLHVLHRLVDAGHTVVVIEHQLDVIAEADWVIDLGPEGGSGGGRIVAQGAPESVAKVKGSYTGIFLKPLLKGS
ncbi:MAG: excinuclease ABC subunit UvrA [Kiritimatiellia bacterium]